VATPGFIQDVAQDDSTKDGYKRVADPDGSPNTRSKLDDNVAKGSVRKARRQFDTTQTDGSSNPYDIDQA